MLDVFNDDEFGLVPLTLAMETLPYQPGMIGEKGWFKKQGITQPVVSIESKGGKLQLLPTAARGTMPTTQSQEKRKIRWLSAVHIPQTDRVTAAEVSGLRAFAEEDTLDTVNNVLNTKLERIKQDFEVTLEYHRLGALQGEVKDADGTSVLYNLFDVFGVTEEEIDIDFGTDDVPLKILEVERTMQDIYPGITHRGLSIMCGDTFFDSLIASEQVKDKFEVWLENKAQFGPEAGAVGLLRGFTYAGAEWWNYRGSVGDVKFVPDAEARVVPLGIPDFLFEYYAPADFIETVNSIGRPYYIKQQPDKWNLGIDIYAQSNPLMMCTRPQLLIKLNDTTTP